MRTLWIVLVTGCTFIGQDHHDDRIAALCAADPAQPGCPDPGTPTPPSPPTPTPLPLVDCFTDADGDGFGAGPAQAVQGDCPTGTVLRAGDCDDGDQAVHPDATEVQGDGVDQDCDGIELCWADADDDGWGDDAADPVEIPAPFDCAQVLGVADQGEDCDDGDPTSWPGAPEVCGDRIDHDCDGELSGGSWYLDQDGDGWGDPDTLVASCDSPSIHHIQRGGDCDDADPAVHPTATEVPADGVDQDCDGAELCWVDADGDGIGADLAPGSLGCDQPGESLFDGDCDDDCAACLPGGIEICDGLDNDCNGVEDDVLEPPSWYTDADGDGWGTEPLVQACVMPPGHAPQGEDCDDANPLVHPGMTEICGNGIDDNCDPDDDASGSAWYQDQDGDGQGAGEALLSCSAPTGRVANDLDCNDLDPNVFTGNPAVVVGDGVDQDCDGVDECWPDPDGDGYAAVGLPPVPAQGDSCGGLLAAADGDCAPNNPLVHPGAAEVPSNNIDENCDGLRLCWVDGDQDTYGAANSVPQLTSGSCTDPGFSLNDDDCDDAASGIRPGVVDVIDDIIDQNCDGLWACRQDADEDTYSTNVVVQLNHPCLPTSIGDCDDADPLTYPGAIELCDGRNNACTGAVPSDEQDLDGDGYVACRPWVGPTGPKGGDCDETRATVHPGALELCDGLDNDCDPNTSELGLVTAGGINHPSLHQVLNARQHLRIEVCGGTHDLAADHPLQGTEVVGVGSSRPILRHLGTYEPSTSTPIFRTDSELTLRGLDFDGGNQAIPGSGSCVRMDDALLVLDDVRFDACVAEEYGGAIFLAGPAGLEVSGGGFYANASELGGAIYCANCAGVSVTDSEFLQNISPFGGAIFAQGNGSGGGPSVVLADTLFMHNLADHGGAIVQQYGSLSATGVDFTANDAVYTAGAVSLLESSVTFNACTFDANVAEVAGSAVDADLPSPLLVLNSVIEDHLDYGRPALTLHGGTTTIQSSTVRNNVLGVDLRANGTLHSTGSDWNGTPDNGNDVHNEAANLYFNVPGFLVNFTCSPAGC